jgi:hypothetical protein
MLYTVAIAICLVGTAPHDCERNTAVDYVYAPEQAYGLVDCMIFGQLYAATSNLVSEGVTYPKVFCIAPTSIGKGDLG